jgi:hypothetical protein
VTVSYKAVVSVHNLKIHVNKSKTVVSNVSNSDIVNSCVQEEIVNNVRYNSCQLSRSLIQEVNGEVQVMQRAIDIARIFQGDNVRQMSFEFMTELFANAWKYGSTIFAVKEAIIWGNGFKFPSEVHSRDLCRQRNQLTQKNAILTWSVCVDSVIS